MGRYDKTRCVITVYNMNKCVGYIKNLSYAKKKIVGTSKLSEAKVIVGIWKAQDEIDKLNGTFGSYLGFGYEAI